MKIVHGWFPSRVWTTEEILGSVGVGWSTILTELLKDLEALSWDGELYQVKEKFGSLRFYVGAVSDEIERRIVKAEDDSRKTCEKCGEPGTPKAWNSYWILTLCEKHGTERAES